MKLRSKMLLGFMGLPVVVFAIFSFYVLHKARNEARNLVIQQAVTVAVKRANEARAALIHSSDAIDTLAIVVEGLKRDGMTDRNFLPRFFKDYLERHSGIFGIWAVFPKDAWDGKDARVASDPEYSPSGTFLPWAFRTQQGIHLQSGMANDLESDFYGDFYKLPMEKKAAVFLEPYEEKQTSGEIVLMTSYAVPLWGKNLSPFGVIGFDVSLDIMAFATSINLPFKGAYALLFSSEGMVLSRQDGLDTAGKTLAEIEGEELAGLLVRDSDASQARVLSTGSGPGRMLRVYEPIVLPGLSKPWGYVVSIPEAELYGSANRFSLILGLVSLLALICMALPVLVISSKIIKPIKAFGETFAKMEAGDLSVRAPSVGGDEIGRLGLRFNDFSSRLASLVRSVSKAAEGVEKTGVALAEANGRTSVALASIRETIEHSSRALDEQSAAEAQAGTQAMNIVLGIDEMIRLIAEASGSIAEASASVEEMVGNVQSVAKSAKSIREEIKGLDASSAEGKKKLSAAAMAISEVVAKSEDLLSANKVIADIAARTDLLAMNAAIEAAHAGATGKGFSVVAGEIRKLAENARFRSKEIGERLGDMSRALDAAFSSSRAADEAFDGILARIGEVSRLETEVYAASTEQREGGNVVLASLGQMRESTAKVELMGKAMGSVGGEVQKAMENLKLTSERVYAEARTVRGKADEIEHNGAEALRLASENRELVESFNAELGRFKT